ncbi:DNA topoisomerase III [Fibrobacterota bacterium]
MAEAIPKQKTKNTTGRGKILIIAEKPSVAQDIIKALPKKFKDLKTYYENDSHIVSFAVGHLVTICTPPEIDPKHKTWSLENLPIIPEEFPLKSLRDSKSQLNSLTKLIRRRDVSEIINACDAGREGELIFRYILQFVGRKRSIKKKLSRLWLQSMTKESIVEGFNNLRKDIEMKSLASAAICRSEADWLIGINGSRALTSFKSRLGGFRLTPCGRVQTPTLTMLIQREKEIKNFTPKKYWEIEGTFSFKSNEYVGKWFDPNFKRTPEDTHKKPDRIWKKSEADAVIQKCQGKHAEVTDTSKPLTQSCPMLYDLTSLQREANNRFGFSAKMTLDIMQVLYEKHKVVTYPRTGSRHLPENYLKSVKNVFKSLEKTDFGTFAKKALEKQWIKFSKKVFDDTKVSDHHAVIPTVNRAHKLSEAEFKIYKMIVQRFLAIFYPPARLLHTVRISKVQDEVFKTEGKIIKDPGWRIIYGVTGKEQSVIPPLSPQAKVILREMDLRPDSTKPPPRHTESSLLSMMEGAGKLMEEEELRDAMKEKGLGTPATRAAIIEGLIKDKYVVRRAKTLVPSAKATELIESITAMKIEELTSPEMTGEWEYRLEQISRAKLNRENFMKDIRTLTENIVEKVKSFDEDADSNRTEVCLLPGTKKRIYETLSFYQSEDGKIKIRKFLGGRHLSREELKQLLTDKKLGPLTGFISKDGKPFSALLKLNKQNRVEFVFEDVSENPPDFKTMSVVGVSPLDGAKVYEGEMSFISETAYKKNCKTGLRINKVILGREITRENVVRMLEGKKTSLIQGFLSTKTKKFFDAYLSLPKSGKIAFSFPPRAFKKKKKQTPS